MWLHPNKWERAIFLATTFSLQDLSSLTEDWTLGPRPWKQEVLPTGLPGYSQERGMERRNEESWCMAKKAEVNICFNKLDEKAQETAWIERNQN